ncbi:MAG: VOC family protein [Gemmatimonadaceae bacterium]|jgi:hypothetical protein|nr:VOC family protein [Gemmatimonadaceae bacterium]
MHTPPPNSIAHFAINADDTDRARRFYERVFGWRFQSWGPPGFWMIERADGGPPGVLGSLQGRRDLGDARLNAFEVTIAVSDAHATAERIAANGGTILMPPTVIPTVGTLCWFRDAEGNVAGIMQYDRGATAEGP